MAEDTQQQEKTEQPSDKKLADAREKGRVPRSRELSTTVVMLAAAGCCLAMQSMWADGLQEVVASGLSFDRELVFDPSTMPRMLGRSIGLGMQMLAPIWIVLSVAAVLGSVAFGGWVFSPDAFAPKLEKLNPIKGLKRVFGWNGLAELAKSLGKFLVVAIAASGLLWWLAPQFMSLGSLTVDGAIARAASLAAMCFLGFAAALLLITAADVPFQYWNHRQQLRMTKQEQKDESKETDGRPEVKQRIRNAQHQIATQRMMVDVQTADVIAMNPTHFAVALRYDAKSMKAPKVVAKGADLVALAIRRVGEAHGVPIFEHPSLARALFHNTRIGQQISPRLYVAVAQVLTYVYQLRQRAAPSAKPTRPDIAIDADLLVPDRERRRAERMRQA